MVLCAVTGHEVSCVFGSSEPSTQRVYAQLPHDTKHRKGVSRRLDSGLTRASAQHVRPILTLGVLRDAAVHR
eukprot:4352937-Amphidinium_carterae.1